MAQRVTLAVPDPSNPGQDINVGTALSPLVVSGGAGASSSQVQGNVASGAVDLGNPVKIGALVASAPAVATNGNRTDLIAGPRGSLHTELWIDGNNSAIGGGSGAADAVVGTLLALQTRSYGTVFNGTTWDRQRGDTTGTYTVSKGTSTLATAQGSVTTSSSQMVPARVGRASVTIINESTTVIRYGASGVTAANGAYLAGVAGTAVTVNTAAAIHGIVGTGTAAFSYIENY